ECVAGGSRLPLAPRCDECVPVVLADKWIERIGNHVGKQREPLLRGDRRELLIAQAVVLSFAQQLFRKFPLDTSRNCFRSIAATDSAASRQRNARAKTPFGEGFPDCTGHRTTFVAVVAQSQHPERISYADQADAQTWRR